MDGTIEHIVFMVIRGIVALAIIGLGFYCIGQGIHFFMLPHTEAEQIHLHLLGLDLSASGLGAIIFSTGVVLCWVGKNAAPIRIDAERGVYQYAKPDDSTPSTYEPTERVTYMKGTSEGPKDLS